MGQSQKSRKVNGNNNNSLSYVITEEMYAQVWSLNYIFYCKHILCERITFIRAFTIIIIAFIFYFWKSFFNSRFHVENYELLFSLKEKIFMDHLVKKYCYEFFYFEKLKINFFLCNFCVTFNFNLISELK